jgi:hypothetical protein
MNDSTDPQNPQEPADTEPAGTEQSDAEPNFTKEPQPELPLELRKQKAGWNKNRVGIWIVVGGFALYLIITGIVGILTKAR